MRLRARSSFLPVAHNGRRASCSKPTAGSCCSGYPREPALEACPHRRWATSARERVLRRRRLGVFEGRGGALPNEPSALRVEPETPLTANRPSSREQELVEEPAG